MVWTKSVLILVFVASTMANQPYYSSYFRQRYTPSENRRVDSAQDTDEGDSYQSSTFSRTANERSIPYKSEAQGLREQGRVRPSEDMLRNGNTTFKYGNSFVKSFPVVTNRRGISESESAVVFPGPTSRRSMFVPEISAKCQGMDFCEEVPNYPQEYVDNLIQQAGPGVSKYFNVDYLTPEVSQRRGAELENKELCQSEERLYFPQAAKNIDGKWFFVLNKKDKQVQGFKSEVCTGIGKPCDKIVVIDPMYKHQCRQKWSQRMILGLDEQGDMVLETIKTESCCYCHLKELWLEDEE